MEPTFILNPYITLVIKKIHDGKLEQAAEIIKNKWKNFTIRKRSKYRWDRTKLRA